MGQFMTLWQLSINTLTALRVGRLQRDLHTEACGMAGDGQSGCLTGWGRAEWLFGWLGTGRMAQCGRYPEGVTV